MSELKDRLQLQISMQNKELELTKRFPDLKEHLNRWKHRRLCSKSFNSMTVSAEISHNCGCCSDSPLEVWPYVEVDGIRVFSDPPVFAVGERSNSRGEIEYEGWQETLKKDNISQAVIDYVQAYFDKYTYEETDED